MTLGQAFTRAIELEAGYQLSKGVSLARPPEVIQVQEIEEVDEIGTGQRRSSMQYAGNVERKGTCSVIVHTNLQIVKMMI